jgi:hypothetical protein
LRAFNNSAVVVNRPQPVGGRILLAGVAAGFFVSSDLLGPRIADAFEFETQTKQDSSSEKTTFKGQANDSVGWLRVKFDSTLWNMKPWGTAAPTSYDLMTSKPVPMDLNEVPIVTSTLADTRATVGMWDDWVRWTSRQAVSNYIQPGTDLLYLARPGFGADDVATSQHIDAGIWKTGSMKLSVFAEYDRVGAYFEAPQSAIKPQDPFSRPDSTTTRLGGTIEWTPITFTLEQRVQQSLAQYNAPMNVEYQIGVSLSLDELRTRSGWLPQGMSWLMPSSAYLIVGQGRVRAAFEQGVNGDTTSDVSAGLSWNVGNFYANVDYWWSDYRSQLYPWKGSGLNGSLGFYEDQWGIDLYFDVYRSSYGYTQQLGDVLAGQALITQMYNDISGGFRFTRHF